VPLNQVHSTGQFDDNTTVLREYVYPIDVGYVTTYFDSSRTPSGALSAGKIWLEMI